MPQHFQHFGKKYPAVAHAYETLDEATQQAGPLDPKTRALVKLALAVGAWREGAVLSHVRRALVAGCAADEVRDVVLLATTTIGFPSMMGFTGLGDDLERIIVSGHSLSPQRTPGRNNKSLFVG